MLADKIKRWLALPGAALAVVVLLSPFPPAQARIDGRKRDKIDAIIIHTIAGPYCADGRVAFSDAEGDAQKWLEFFNQHIVLGIHYIIDRSGQTLAGIPESQIANHASGHNDTSIGIELVHQGNGHEPFGEAQIDALVKLIVDIRTRHKIGIENIKAHADIDERRFECGGQSIKEKQDPGANFPWTELRAALLARAAGSRAD